MNAIAGIRPRQFTLTEFAAFKAEQIGKRWVTNPLPISGAPANVNEAVQAALTGPRVIYHKDTLVIRETDDDGTRLHVFRIRKRAPIYVRGDFGLGTRRVEDLYADPVCVLDGAVLAAAGVE